MTSLSDSAWQEVASLWAWGKMKREGHEEKKKTNVMLVSELPAAAVTWQSNLSQIKKAKENLVLHWQCENYGPLRTHH